jgi:hypothetical protein
MLLAGMLWECWLDPLLQQVCIHAQTAGLGSDKRGTCNRVCDVVPWHRRALVPVRQVIIDSLCKCIARHGRVLDIAHNLKHALLPPPLRVLFPAVNV